VFDFSPLLTGAGLASLASLSLMEIVLGIDNILLIAILSQKVEASRRKQVRRLGIGLALVMRLGLLFTISWMMGLTRPLFEIPFVDDPISGRDLVLLVGGLFLIYKATHELFDRIERAPPDTHADPRGTEPGAAGSHGRSGFGGTLAQILALDLVFSLDSVITAVGMAQAMSIMMIAMVIAVSVMLIFANVVADFVIRHPSMKILALSFLLMIGILLTADAFGQHLNRGYIYFAMAFSLTIELLNMRLRKKSTRTRAF
jgi:predicted tellurium resistance membrane protein TerC